MRRSNTNRFFAVLAASAMTLGAVQATQAVVSFDQNITPDVIFGSGNANGGWTVDRSNGVEVGLRAKERFPPSNTFNSNGDGTYNHLAGNNGGNTPLWSFEWSVNIDFNNTTSFLGLADLIYEIRLDTDPSSLTSFTTFDPIIQPVADNAIGDNTTGNGGGAVAGNATDYGNLITNAANNVAQNSWRMDFFFPALGPAFDPNVNGTYDFELAVFAPGPFASNVLVAETRISVIVGTGGQTIVPEPMTAGLGMMGLAALGFATRRRSHA